MATSEGKSGATQGSVVEAASNAAGQVTGSVREQASRVAGQATEQAKSMLNQQKDLAAGHVEGMAQALHKTVDELRRSNIGPLAEYAERAVGSIDSFASNLRERSIDDLIGDIEDFARRQPTLFVAGSIFAGFAFARFLKSSSRRRSMARGGYAGGGHSEASRYSGQQASGARAGAQHGGASGGYGGQGRLQSASGSSAGGAPFPGKHHLHPQQPCDDGRRHVFGRHAVRRGGRLRLARARGRDGQLRLCRRRRRLARAGRRLARAEGVHQPRHLHRAAVVLSGGRGHGDPS